MSAIWYIARQTVRECRRRRVFLVVPIVTIGFLLLYGLGNYYAFQEVGGTTPFRARLVDTRALAGATLIGLSMFTTLFLGAALGIFLTFNTVRGDAETGVLQPLVVRPVARSGILLGRFIGASMICCGYVLALYIGSVLMTGAIGHWWPNPVVLPGLALAVGIVILIALTLLGSIFLSSITNGIAMFMVYGAGLLAGLLGQLGDLLDSDALRTTGKVTSFVLPFEALYQAGLNSLTSGARGLTRVIVQLGPLGGAQAGGPLLLVWCLVYLAIIGLSALTFFARRDL
jgi:ABC-type transport system involved in multi-copper enzyme maturation permease subunit